MRSLLGGGTFYSYKNGEVTSSIIANGIDTPLFFTGINSLIISEVPQENGEIVSYKLHSLAIG